MNYEDEDYVRLYTRETITWKALGWEGQACVLFLIKGKFDRAGLIDLGGVELSEAVVALTGLPRKIVEVGMPRVIAKKVFELHDGTLVWPHFIEAQTATKSPVERQREHRQRKRDMVRAGIDPSLREAVIYFVQSEHGGAVKIGRADDLAKRIVGLQTGRPDKLVLLAAFSGTRADERELHSLLATYRESGEWFRPDPIVMAAANYASQHGSRVLELLKTGDALPVTVRDSKPSTVASPVTPSLSDPSVAEPKKEDPPTPLPPVTSRPDPLLKSLVAPPRYRADVLELFELWKQTFGFAEAVLGLGTYNLDAETLAAAIDALDLEACKLVLRHAPNDGMVSGRDDEHDAKHETIAYIFGKQTTLNRILRDARKAERGAVVSPSEKIRLAGELR